MCGIIGVASLSPVEDRAWLRIGRDTMQHRGPDDDGEWWSKDGRIGFGHRRLSVIDLSAAGHQPMEDVEKDLCIVFNGEIYNFAELRYELERKGYLFRSQSDTEVILAAYREWNSKCVTRFNGMFAFALYDSRRELLFMARDRAGEKPLFYAQDNTSLRFASELKGLMADRNFARMIDLKAFDCYLGMGFVPGDHCILKGVKKLPPAHALVFDLRTSRSHVWNYWQLPEFDSRETDELEGGADLLDELEGLLEDSVRRQMVADVSVGILLSGGLDSSLVTAIAARTNPDVKTFTVRFPGHGHYDETKHARLIAKHFGTKHVELDAANCTFDLLPLLARQFDEPIVDSSMIPTYLLSRLVRNYCIVALGGDGGDELFGGYEHYSRLLWMQNRMGKIPLSVRGLVANSAARLLPIGFKGRNWLQALGTNLEKGTPRIAKYFDRKARLRLLNHSEGWWSVSEEVEEERAPKSGNLLQRATRQDFENYLAEDILVKVDRASMANSLEVRAPMLDYRLIEFAFSRVPSSKKATTKNRKLLPKELASRILPAGFDHARKQGFAIPLGTWLQLRPWKQFFNDVLLHAANSPFDRKMLQSLLRGQEMGRSNSERLFALVLFELWRQEYGVSM